MLPAEIQEQIAKLPAESQALVQVIILFYEARIAELEAKNAALEARVKELEERLSKDSHNSSKPPSSDSGLKPNPKSLRKKSGRNPGGQKGRRGRTLKRVGNPDHIERHSVLCCSGCHHDLSDHPVHSIERRQLFDIPPLQLEVTEHQTEIKRCPVCNQLTQALFPDGLVSPAQYGPNLRAMLSYLGNYQLIPFARLSEFMLDLLGHRVSPGTIHNIQKDAYNRLDAFEASLKPLLRGEAVAGFDETGLKVNGCLMWLHLCSTEGFAYYKMHQNRGVAAMDDAGILPHFQGVAVHDFWKSYYQYNTRHALCNAHLLRELIFIEEQYEQPWASDMTKLLRQIKKQVDKARREGKMNLPDKIRLRYRTKYDHLVTDAIALNPVPDSPPGKRGRKKKPKPLNLAERLRDYADDVLRFMTDFHVPFDNNLAERDLRMMKVKQKISGTFRSLDGADYFARIRSYIVSARKQGINAFTALQDLFSDMAAPQMILQGTNGQHRAE